MLPAVEDAPPAWWTAAATAASYLLVLGVLFVLLFGVPYLVFAAA